MQPHGKITKMQVLHYSDKKDPDFINLYQKCDMLITTGDLSRTDFGIFETIPHPKPAFGVYGNHDDGGSYLEDFEIVNVHSKVVKYNDLKIGGFQGCPRYNSRDMQFSEDEAKAFADTFPYVDILILHAGPKDMLDEADPVHIGSKHIRRYVLEKKPKIIFCGHQYSNAEMEIEGIKIFRTYGARLLEISI